MRPASAAKQLRPIKLLQPSAKLLVEAENYDLSQYGACIACGEQWGLLPGSSIAENMVELQGVLMEHSMGAGVGGLPALSHRCHMHGYFVYLVVRAHRRLCTT